MPFHHATLPNGLTLLGETSPSARSVSLGFFVRTGSRDEAPPESGVSHFLEHMVFKGTPRRTAFDVNRDFDRIGADYNAFTSEENTVFYASVLPEYLPQAVDILADILRPSLRDDDFNTEKKVIIEEIGMYEDNPTWSAYDQARKLHFGDHPLGNSVLGSVRSITDLTSAQMRDYFHRRYSAANVLVAAAGQFEWERFVDEVSRRCAGWPGGAVDRANLRAAPAAGGTHVIAKERVALETVILMAPSPASASPLRHAADVLALAVGDDSGSRLYWELVDPGLADSADMSAHEYDAAGSYYVSLSCPPEATAENLATVREVLAGVQRDGLTAEELAQAKNKISSRLVRGYERPRGRMQALGMNWTYLKQYRDVDDELKAFDAVTLEKVREVLAGFPLDGFTTLAYGPLTELAAR
jgi:predicted Zn-dependent peptidase